MTRLIKSGAGGGGPGAVLPYRGSARVMPPAPEAVAAARTQAQIAGLEEALRCRDDHIAELKREAENESRLRYEEGLKAGRQMAEDRQAARVDVLRDALANALADFQGQLAAMERSAILVARECLEVIFGDESSRAAMVQKLIAHQLGQFDPSSLVRIAVSRQDFADDALESLRAELVLARIVELQALDIPSGDCAIDLELGRLDIGLSQQWGALREQLGISIDHGALA